MLRTALTCLKPPLKIAELTAVKPSLEKTAKTLSFMINLAVPARSNCSDAVYSPGYFLRLLGFIVMALVGQRLTQTPQLVHSTTSITCGFLFLPSSKTPCGQTPTQISPAHGEHLAVSMVIRGSCLPMRINN